MKRKVNFIIMQQQLSSPKTTQSNIGVPKYLGYEHLNNGCLIWACQEEGAWRRKTPTSGRKRARRTELTRLDGASSGWKSETNQVVQTRAAYIVIPVTSLAMPASPHAHREPLYATVLNRVSGVSTWFHSRGFPHDLTTAYFKVFFRLSVTLLLSRH